MKKLSLYAFLGMLFVSAPALCKIQFEEPVGDSSYGYIHNANDKACPPGKVLTVHGECVVCVNDHDGNAQDLGCTASTPLCNGDQGKAGTACMEIRNVGIIAEPKLAEKCAKTEFRHPSTAKCTACPANATCNGTEYTCKKGFEKEKTLVKGIAPKCIPVISKCKQNQYMVDKTCVACPKGATCDGHNPNCPYGYTKDKKGYVTCKSAPTCTTKQYLVNNKCTACPANATCNGKTATCKKGMKQTVKEGKVTCAAVKKCKKGSHEGVAWIRTHYKNCSKCGTENVKTCSKNKKAHKHYYCECDC